MLLRMTSRRNSPRGLVFSYCIGARLPHVHRVVAEIGQLQVLAQQAAVGVRVGAHAPRALRRQRPQLRHQPAIGVEQLLRLVAAHPVFEQLQAAQDCSRTSENGTWCERQEPSAL